MYVQLNQDGTFWRQVRELRNFEWDASHFCPPEKLTVGESAYFRVYPLTLTTRPTTNAITQGLREIDPIQVDGVWTQQWEVYELPAETAAANLANAKLSAWAAIKAERDRRKAGGVLVSGKWFHSDVDSRIQQLGLVMMGASVPSVQWKTMDGSFVTMSQAIANGIFQAAAALDMSLFAVAEAHRLAMEASADPGGYDFSANWPTHYAEA